LANKFDRTNYPTQEPYQLQLGDRWVWVREDLNNDYDTDDYSLSYEFNIVDGSTAVNFTITATEANDKYYVEVGSSTTANYTKGNYHWYAYITRSSDSERIMIDEGYTEIVDNYATTSSDIRSHAKTCLDAIEAVIENRASIDQQSMSIKFDNKLDRSGKSLIENPSVETAGAFPPLSTPDFTPREDFDDNNNNIT